MKNFAVLLLFIFGGACLLLFMPQTKNDVDYLRIHIRANSNLAVDQNIKYEIKEKIVDYVTPYLANATSKQKALDIVDNLTRNIKKICDDYLLQNNFDYQSKATLKKENFPTRTYDGTTLEGGEYDALIINLGTGEGDNWWCVIYPPLCFVNSNVCEQNIYYKSKLKEIIEKFFK